MSTYLEKDKQKRKELKKTNHNSFSKKTIALITAGIMAVSGFAVGLNSCNKDDSNNAGTSVSDQNDENENQEFEYVLYKPTDMNNADERQELLTEANKVAGEELNEKIIRFFNDSELDDENKLSKSEYKNMSDDEIADEIYDYAIEYYDWLDSNQVDELINNKAEILSDETTQSQVSNDEYMLLTPFSTTDENSYIYQNYQQDYDTIINNEVEDIVTSNVQDFSSNAEAFYKVVRKVMEDPEVSKNQNLKSMFLEGAKENYRLFASVLRYEYPEYYEWLEKEFQNNSLNSWVGTFLDRFGIVFDEQACANKIKNYEKYNSEDEKLAEAYKGTTGTGKKTITNNNNKKTSELASEGTTAVTSSTTIYDVPEDESEKAETTSQKPGGQPVEDPTSSEGTTHVISDEDVKPGTEETYSEETCTFNYVDSNIYNGYSKTLR